MGQENVKVRFLKEIEITEGMLDHFERRQMTRHVLFHTYNELAEKKDEFEDNWTLAQKRDIVSYFRKTISRGGSVAIAGEPLDVRGFAIIESHPFGPRKEYIELSYLHVTQSDRSRGIGEMLFHAAKERARETGAEKLYIGAHPSVETQRFYKRMGCVPARFIQMPIYSREPRDLQLEADLF